MHWKVGNSELGSSKTQDLVEPFLFMVSRIGVIFCNTDDLSSASIGGCLEVPG